VSGAARAAVVGALTLLVILAILYVFAQSVRRSSMFFPSREGDWSTHPDEWLTTSDGVRLHGWLFRADDPKAPMIVWCHGNAGNITERAPFAAELARRGVSVFLFDWRGYGRSEGTPSEEALYRDALAAYDHASGPLHAPAVILYGESLGGPYAAYAARRRKASGVIIENSFPSLLTLGNALYAPLPLGWFAPNAMTTTRWLNEAGVPVLVMHGKRDAVIPFRLGRKLYDDLRVPKEMLVSETAAHCEIPVAEPARYYDAVVRFARESGSKTRP
jgi:fermentation-respiration switch protein FrsA (DUF1100 family)